MFDVPTNGGFVASGLLFICNTLFFMGFSLFLGRLPRLAQNLPTKPPTSAFGAEARLTERMLWRPL